MIPTPRTLSGSASPGFGNDGNNGGDSSKGEAGESFASPLPQMKAKGIKPKDDSWKKKYKEPAGPDTANLPELPEGWAWAKSDQMFSFVTSGSRGWASYYSEIGSVFLRMGNLDHDTIQLDLADIQRVQPPDGAEGLRTRVTAGDILISITADVGMIGMVPEGFEEAFIKSMFRWQGLYRLSTVLSSHGFLPVSQVKISSRNFSEGRLKLA
jgi:hypothetical protein